MQVSALIYWVYKHNNKQHMSGIFKGITYPFTFLHQHSVQKSKLIIGVLILHCQSFFLFTHCNMTKQKSATSFYFPEVFHVSIVDTVKLKTGARPD